jgi:hypothetical protein
VIDNSILEDAARQAARLRDARGCIMSLICARVFKVRLKVYKVVGEVLAAEQQKVRSGPHGCAACAACANRATCNHRHGAWHRPAVRTHIQRAVPFGVANDEGMTGAQHALTGSALQAPPEAHVSGIVEEVASMHPQYGLQLRPRERSAYVASVLPQLCPDLFPTAAPATSPPARSPEARTPANAPRAGTQDDQHRSTIGLDGGALKREHDKAARHEDVKKSKKKSKHQHRPKSERESRSPSPVPAARAPEAVCRAVDGPGHATPQAQTAIPVEAPAGPPKVALGPPKWAAGDAGQFDDDDFDTRPPAWADQSELPVAHNDTDPGRGIAQPSATADPWSFEDDDTGEKVVQAAAGNVRSRPLGPGVALLPQLSGALLQPATGVAPVAAEAGKEAAQRVPPRAAGPSNKVTAVEAAGLSGDRRGPPRSALEAHYAAPIARAATPKDAIAEDTPSVDAATALPGPSKDTVAALVDDSWFAEFLAPAPARAGSAMTSEEYDRRFSVYQRLHQVVTQVLSHFQQCREQVQRSERCGSPAQVERCTEALNRTLGEYRVAAEQCAEALQNLHEQLEHAAVA